MQITVKVPDMMCEHCKKSITDALMSIGVQSVEIDLNSKLVTVTAENLSSSAICEAIEDIGFTPEK